MLPKPVNNVYGYSGEGGRKFVVEAVERDGNGKPLHSLMKNSVHANGFCRPESNNSLLHRLSMCVGP